MRSYSRTWDFVFGLVLCTAPAAKAFQSLTATDLPGQVSGKAVLDSDGSPLSGVTVTLVQISPTPFATLNSVNGGSVTTTAIPTAPGAAATAANTANAVSAKDGSFTASGLARGQFAVCVQDPNASLIDPCLWADSRASVSVNSGMLSSGLVVRVKKASTITVRVNNTGQVLAPMATDTRPPHVLVGAFDTRGVFHPAIEFLKDATGIVYKLAIPVDSPIRLTVYSAQVKLTDSLNALLPASGYSATLVQPSSQLQTKSLTFNATGRN